MVLGVGPGVALMRGICGWRSPCLEAKNTREGCRGDAINTGLAHIADISLHESRA